jgi:hypothetical protein
MVRSRTVATVVVTATVTMAGALALLWPMGAGAENQPAALRIVQPKITVGACQFTMEAAQASAEAGAKPSVTVNVVNTGTTPAEATIWLVVTAASPASRVSRRMEEPETVWSQSLNVTLGGGGQQKLTIPIGADLPQGRSISIYMSTQKPPEPKAAAVQAPGQQLSQAAANQAG